MKLTILLEKLDTENLRQTVSEAFKNGQEWGQTKEAETQKSCSAYYARLLNDIESQAQRIAAEAFEAGRLSKTLP